MLIMPVIIGPIAVMSTVALVSWVLDEDTEEQRLYNQYLEQEVEALKRAKREAEANHFYSLKTK